MDRNDGTVADDATDPDLHAVVVEIQFGRQQKVQHDTVVVEDTSDLFVDTVIQFCHQERIQHQDDDVDRTDDDDTVAVQETDTSVEQVQVHGDMVAYVLPAEVVEETRYADGVFRLNVILFCALCDNLRTDACLRDWFNTRYAVKVPSIGGIFNCMVAPQTFYST